MNQPLAQLVGRGVNSPAGHTQAGHTPTDAGVPLPDGVAGVEDFTLAMAAVLNGRPDAEPAPPPSPATSDGPWFDGPADPADGDADAGPSNTDLLIQALLGFSQQVQGAPVELPETIDPSNHAQVAQIVRQILDGGRSAEESALSGASAGYHVEELTADAATNALPADADAAATGTNTTAGQTPAEPSRGPRMELWFRQGPSSEPPSGSSVDTDATPRPSAEPVLDPLGDVIDRTAGRTAPVGREPRLTDDLVAIPVMDDNGPATQTDEPDFAATAGVLARESARAVRSDRSQPVIAESVGGAPVKDGSPLARLAIPLGGPVGDESAPSQLRIVALAQDSPTDGPISTRAAMPMESSSGSASVATDSIRLSAEATSPTPVQPMLPNRPGSTEPIQPVSPPATPTGDTADVAGDEPADHANLFSRVMLRVPAGPGYPSDQDVRVAQGNDRNTDDSADSNDATVARTSMGSADAKTSPASGTTHSAPATGPAESFDAAANAERIVRAVSSQLHGRAGRSIQLRLDPPGLGQLRIDMTMTGQNVKVTLMASSEASAQLLGSQLHQLREGLESRGLAVGLLTVDTPQRVGSPASPGHDSPTDQSQGGWSGQPGSGGQTFTGNPNNGDGSHGEPWLEAEWTDSPAAESSPAVSVGGRRGPDSRAALDLVG